MRSSVLTVGPRDSLSSLVTDDAPTDEEIKWMEAERRRPPRPSITVTAGSTNTMVLFVPEYLFCVHADRVVAIVRWR